MEKICTTIEQSKRLIELGIDVNSANMHYHTNSMYETYPCDEIVYTLCLDKPQKYNKYDIPAWSLTALLELIPNWTMDKTDKVNLTCNPYYHGEYCYEDIVDAAFEMVCWLLENKKL